MSMINDFISLIYPNLCYSCDEPLRKGESSICTQCYLNLPITDYHLWSNNDLMKKFYGRINIKEAYAFLKFVKEGSVQKLMHKLKYEGKERIGRQLGLWYGSILFQYKKGNYDLIIPVPIHKKKERRRGYNQSHSVAEGLSETLLVEWTSKVLYKTKESSSQTGKNRFDRWKNTKDVFTIVKDDSIAGLNILLVDDVVTTGSTIEACAKLLLDNDCKSISVASLAVAV